jgi:hypothetical protein
MWNNSCPKCGAVTRSTKKEDGKLCTSCAPKRETPRAAPAPAPRIVPAPEADPTPPPANRRSPGRR